MTSDPYVAEPQAATTAETHERSPSADQEKAKYTCQYTSNIPAILKTLNITLASLARMTKG